jgi:formylglycine-generating enzyme required for sulfatase activity
MKQAGTGLFARLGSSFAAMICLALLGGASHADAPAADVRLALVIANGKYADPHLPALANTYVDGDRIAAALTQTRFTDASGAGPVTPRRNLTEAQIVTELHGLADRLKAAGPNSFAVVYFSGHGGAIGSYGDTVLLGTDQAHAGGARVSRSQIADLLLSTGARTVVVVLDMCRTVYEGPTVVPGAQAVIRIPSQTAASEPAVRGPPRATPARRPEQGYLIAFSTSPDQAAFDDGVFSQVLAEEIVRPRQNVAEAFKRVSDRVAEVHSAGHYWQKPTFDYGLHQGGPCFATCDAHDDGMRFYDCANCPWMRIVPAGTAVLGSPASESGRGSDEAQPHFVRFDAPFAMAVFTVTVAEWKACALDGVCRSRPTWAKENPNPLIPATHLSYRDAQDYVTWLSQKSGQIYRLPTEDEWEYAARAGATTAFDWGDLISPGEANYDHTIRYRGSPAAPYRGYPEAVGEYPPNGFGLVQMEGNVWQWTSGCPKASDDSCARHVLRGGSFQSAPAELRLANRFSIDDAKVRPDVGLRVLRQIDPREGF